MEHLSVIGLEDDKLVVESATGQRFAIDASAIPEIRRHRPAGAQERKTSPREIQALMRAGSSAEEVSQTTGEELDYVRRFEGPVLAERDHVLDQALAIAVASGDIDPLARETTFGAAMTARLAGLDADGEDWSTWKEPTGEWTVRLRFEAQGVDHEARWSFEPRKGALTPRDKEATALSQQDDATSVLVPRLRAIDRDDAAPQPQRPDVVRVDAAEAEPSAAQDSPTETAAPASESSSDEPTQGGGAADDGAAARGPRFDSGAFQLQVDAPSKPVTPTRLTKQQDPQQPAAVQEAAIATAKPAVAPNHTADLLEALRKRRGEREAALAHAEREPEAEPREEQQQSSSLFEAEEPEERQGVHHTSPLTNAKPKRGARAAMPSWDEIVFGSRGDDEPA